MARVSRRLGALALGLCVCACHESQSGKMSHSCTEKGCLDSAGFRLHPPDDVWPDGVYALDVAFDDDAYSCAFTVPDAIDAATDLDAYTFPVHCSPDFSDGFIFGAFLDAVMASITHRDGSSKRETWTQIPGFYYLTVRTRKLAQSFSVTVTLDAEPYFDASEPLYYEKNQPNGADCEPTCHNAQTELYVTAPP